MTDITQRLAEVLNDNGISEARYPGIEDLCRDALDRLTELELEVATLKAIKKVDERFDRFFAAALQGVAARCSAADLMRGGTNIVREARRIAHECVKPEPV